ncbi:MAG: glycosyltransferase family 9 protein [Desulfobulbaceae bacterium]|nr:glycosyltransferase family 9 protein [Desulfobulbaceae bacterium]
MLKHVIRVIKDKPIAAPLLLVIDLFLLGIDLLAGIGSRRLDPNKICLVKVDKLGDYVLFRNFIAEIKNSPRFKACRLTLVANIEQKAFIEWLDRDHVDHVIWLDIYQYASNPLYRFRMARRIYQEGFALAVCSTYARVLVLDDFIVRVTKAIERVGQQAHLINMKGWERFFGDRCYTKLLQVSDEVIFEFERNRAFFAHLLDRSLAHLRPCIDIRMASNRVAKSYVLIAPGAGDPFRQWKPEFFAQVADLIVEQYGYDIVLCGSPAEKTLGEALCQSSAHPERISNLIGTLSIPELLTAYRDSCFVVSNESASVHLAAALDCVPFCVSNGNHFLKYSEYPAGLAKSVFYIYPDELDAMRHDDQALARRFDFKSTLDINSIPVAKVIATIAGPESLHSLNHKTS